MSDDEREYRITIGDVERIADRRVLEGGAKILIALYFSGAVIAFLRSFLDL